MSPGKAQAAAEKLKEFARQETQHGAAGPNTPRAAATRGQAAQRPAMEEPDEPEFDIKTAHDRLLTAISSCQTSLTCKIDEVRVDLGLLRQDVQQLRERARQTEDRVSALEDLTRPLVGRVQEVESSINLWRQKCDDLENRARRNNIRILGLPERTKGTDPAAFIEEWFKTVFPEAPFSKAYAVERAHRVPARPPPPSRPLLAKLLNWRDRDMLLTQARRKQVITHGNANISLFPDFSAELQKKRATFTVVKRKLREKSLQYSMAYPARLRVIEGGKTHFFTDPREAEEWVSRRSRQEPPI